MKKLMIAFVALCSASALASPSVGDTATFKIMMNGMSGMMTQTIISYDSSMDSYLVRSETTLNGQKEVKDEATPSNEMDSSDDIKEFLANCAMFGGVSGKMTVQAGTFDSCTISGEQSNMKFSISMGMVPFGVLKLNQADQTGNSAEAELVSFQFGK